MVKAQTIDATDDLTDLLSYSTASERAEMELLLKEGLPWYPLSGPQTLAYLSDADELFYGGAAGGGKTDLALGLAVNSHFNSLILRREATLLEEIVARSQDIIGNRGVLNKTTLTWQFPEGRRIKFGGCEQETDKRKYKGRPKDLYVFDEVSDFLESIVLFITAWNRTTRRGQRCRVVYTGNPPTSADGLWIIRRFAAWLDPKHPRPAKPGELRWYAMVDDKEVERADGTPFLHKPDGRPEEEIKPRSRTFIPARLEDNPILEATGYRAALQALPEPMRSQMLYGDFSIGVADDAWQVIPTMWVQLAMERGRLLDEAARERGKDSYVPRFEPEEVAEGEEPGDGKLMPLSAMGMDVSRGGKDKTVLSPRYGTWFGPLITYEGYEVPNGIIAAGLLSEALAAGKVEDEEGNLVGDAYANIDVIGVGASAYDSASEMGLPVVPINFSEKVYATDRSGLHGFVNMRAYAYWALREALDPVKGDNLALPDDPELLADLTAPKWMPRLGGYQVESKEEIVKRLGRSPDKGDAVVLAALPDMSPRVF
jgi:hypothetical protein